MQTSTVKSTIAAEAAQEERRSQDNGILDDLIKEYKCMTKRCPNRDGWCYIENEAHSKIRGGQFRAWAMAIQNEEEDVDFDTPPKNLRFVPVQAVRSGKNTAKTPENNQQKCQEPQPSPMQMGTGFAEALMPFLIQQSMQQMISPIQQQLALLSQQTARSLPPPQPNFSVNQAEYLPPLSQPLPRRRSPPERPTSSSRRSGGTRNLPSSPIGSKGDRASHLRRYIRWLQRRSPSLSTALESAYHILNTEQFSLTTVRRWAEKSDPWTRLDIRVGLGLQIADRESIKEWWYMEGDISETEAEAMGLDAIDLDETQG